MKKTLVLLVSIILITACSENKKNKVTDFKNQKNQIVPVRDINSHFGSDLGKLEQLVKSIDQNNELKQIKSDSTFGDVIVSTIKYLNKDQVVKIEQIIRGSYVNEVFTAYYPIANIPTSVHYRKTQLMCDDQMNTCYVEYKNYYVDGETYLKKHGSNLLTSKFKKATYKPGDEPNFNKIEYLTNPNDANSILQNDLERVKNILKT